MKNLFVKVPSSVIRNEKFYISNQEFSLYANLCYKHFRNGNKEEIVLDHKKLMNELKINDTRTLKKRFNALHKYGLINNKIDKLPTKGYLSIFFNSEAKNEGNFCKMNPSIFTYFKNEQIDENGVRLAFYYKSHINPNDKRRIDYCYVSFEVLKSRLKMGNTTIIEANKSLKKAKLLKIVKHKLEDTGSYDENDALIFDKWNNHYHILSPLY
ncbi:hypothetical protein MOC02_18145 [Bacillus inaquosorum]|uniref:hypothetical protein n=1 Tax=Bacillus inaquosorum TaxID=483913 RepID=UPI0022819761|nr:hypothetical protein [Bacillus inaquosorum]MCY8085136.1 hypothetical protein [Bacillus inaquosorum]MCY8126057.1 hypothetical protein [Bacillus spizizenii]